MLNAEELKYIEEEIKQAISNIEREHFQYIMGEQYEEGYQEDYPGWTIEWIKTRLNDLYIMITVYMEARGMQQLLQTFKSKFETRIENEYQLLSTTFTNPEGEPEVKLIVEFKKFLAPFKFFDYRPDKENQLFKLLSILSNTGFILKNINQKIKNEASIYKQVKWVLNLYYPSTRHKNNAAFIKSFKCYNPDILIPELNAAIEYKYIDNPNDNVDEFLDQLIIDATNYTGDHQYKHFFAVVYIEDISIATPESIQEAWQAKHFPDNWQLVLSGHTIKTSYTRPESK